MACCHTLRRWGGLAMAREELAFRAGMVNELQLLADHIVYSDVSHIIYKITDIQVSDIHT